MGRKRDWPGRRTFPTDPKKPISNSWLFQNQGSWRMLPLAKHPRQCSWCGGVFTVLRSRFFVCGHCDAPEREQRPDKEG